MTSKKFLPHDLLFLRPETSLPAEAPEWVRILVKESLPCVVRRDRFSPEKIPVGFRGETRSKRYGTYIAEQDVLTILSPEGANELLKTTYLKAPQLDYLQKLASFIREDAELKDTLAWGVTGSFGFSLAVGKRYFRENSDIDLILRANSEEQLKSFYKLEKWLFSSDFQIDVQIQTDRGGFSYKEWLKSEKVLLKTDTGPCITDNPW